MAQENAVRKQYSGNTYTRENYRETVRHNDSVEANQPLSLSKFEKTILVTGVLAIVVLMLGVVSVKNNLNSSQRALQNVSTTKNRISNQNQSFSQELDGVENDAIQQVVKKDKLSLSTSNVRDVTR